MRLPPNHWKIINRCEGSSEVTTYKLSPEELEKTLKELEKKSGGKLNERGEKI